MLCESCVYLHFCEKNRKHKCINYVQGIPQKKEYDLTLASQGYYNK